MSILLYPDWRSTGKGNAKSFPAGLSGKSQHFAAILRLTFDPGGRRDGVGITRGRSGHAQISS